MQVWGFYILIFIQLRFFWEMADLFTWFFNCFFCIFSHNYFLNNNIPQFSFYGTLILIIPITDINYVFFSRIFDGISPFYPDRRHLHFKIQNFGFTHKETVILFYLICLLFSAQFLRIYMGKILYTIIFHFLLYF